MQTIWRSLLWREWHEHKWKLAAIMLSLQLLLLVEDPGLATPQIIVWALCGACGAFFLGLHAASGERSSRTLEFVRALPVKTRRVAIAKLAMGAMASVLPIAVAMLLAIAWLLARQAGGASFAYRESFIARGAPVAEVGRQIFELILEVASGRKTKSELHGIGEEEFAPWSIGPTL